MLIPQAVLEAASHHLLRPQLVVTAWLIRVVLIGAADAFLAPSGGALGAARGQLIGGAAAFAIFAVMVVWAIHRAHRAALSRSACTLPPVSVRKSSTLAGAGDGFMKRNTRNRPLASGSVLANENSPAGLSEGGGAP